MMGCTVHERAIMEPQDALRPDAVQSSEPLSKRAAELGRDIAQLLRDPHARAMVYRAIHQSQFDEGKVSWASFLRDLPQEVQAHVSTNTEPILSEFGDLEMYLPVESHRVLWSGDSNLVVTVYLGGDAPLPGWIGWDLAGSEIPLSIDQPPATPVLVLHRPEGMSRSEAVPLAQCYEDCGGGGGGGGTQSGYRMIGWNIASRTWDPWPSSKPEFEVTIVAIDANGNYLKDSSGKPNVWQCVGENFMEGNARYWNYNNTGTFETGDLGVLDGTQPADPAYQRAAIIVSENDDTGVNPLLS